MKEPARDPVVDTRIQPNMAILLPYLSEIKPKRKLPMKSPTMYMAPVKAT